jgi:hypothetical protein
MNSARAPGLGKIMRTLLLAVALFAGVAAYTPAAANAAPTAQVAAVQHQTGPALHTGPITTQASYYCAYYWTAHRVDLYCDIYSGYLRLWVTCSDGRRYYTPWATGPGQHFWFDCSPGYVVTFGYETAG